MRNGLTAEANAGPILWPIGVSLLTALTIGYKEFHDAQT